jgi:Mce-associated membrane protein
MTKPHSAKADEKSDQPKGESAAVRVPTDAASEQEITKAEATDRVEGEAVEASEKAEGTKPAQAKRRVRSPRARTVNGQAQKSFAGEVKERSDATAAAGDQDGGEAEVAIADAAEAGEKAEGTEPAQAKRRVRAPRARTRKVIPPPSADAEDPSDPQDEKSVEAEAKEPSEVTAAAGERDGGEAEAVISDEAAISDDAEVDENAEKTEPAQAKRRISWSRVVVYGVLPGLALSLAPAAGYLKWQDASVRDSQIARVESVAAAKDSTIALLSYKSDTVEKDLDAAKSRLTGAFKESYSHLINDVVIPGSKREHISTTATVPAASSVSATPDHAVALLFVNQSAVIGKDAPSDTDSSVRVTLDKVAGRWLISGFDPV